MSRVRLLLLMAIAIFPAFAQQTQQTEDEKRSGNKAKPEEQRLTVENIKQKTEILRNPGLAVKNAEKVFAGKDPATEPDGESKPALVHIAAVTLENNDKRISDPTQMTGSFRQAVDRIKPAGGGPANAPKLPKITLAAKAIRQKNNKAVLLSVADKTRLVKEGNRISFVEDNQFYEIVVQKIDQDQVVITLFPMGREMVLQ